jgi:hypothetical protein
MDSFSIIQNFFTRMKCHFCTSHLEPEGVELIRHDKGVYIVNISCVHCTRQMGVAMVGLEGSEWPEGAAPHYPDPELTEDEIERLSVYEPIGVNDVIDAHQFFNNLGSDWQKHLPEEMRQWETTYEAESEEV